MTTKKTTKTTTKKDDSVSCGEYYYYHHHHHHHHHPYQRDVVVVVWEEEEPLLQLWRWQIFNSFLFVVDGDGEKVVEYDTTNNNHVMQNVYLFVVLSFFVQALQLLYIRRRRHSKTGMCRL